jgi:hypothetical protein
MRSGFDRLKAIDVLQLIYFKICARDHLRAMDFFILEGVSVTKFACTIIMNGGPSYLGPWSTLKGFYKVSSLSLVIII